MLGTLYLIFFLLLLQTVTYASSEIDYFDNDLAKGFF